MDVINVYSPVWDPALSYGRVARELADALTRMGVYVNRFDGLQAGPIIPSVGGILLAYPTNFPKFGPFATMGPTVAVTMFESTVLPPDWNTHLNNCDSVIVPTHWLVDVFKQSGVKAPVYAYPLGISKAYQPIERLTGQRPYTFLAIGDQGLRKGSLVAVSAFARAFGEDMNYRLIIKALNYNINFEESNITILRGSYTDEQMAALYAQCDCMVFPSCGEGFGLPPREFAATGGTVIATDWGGTGDDLCFWGEALRHTMETAWLLEKDHYGICGEWARPDVDHLVTLMQRMAHNHAYARAMGEQAARYTQSAYSWDKFAAHVYRHWLEAKEKHYANASAA